MSINKRNIDRGEIPPRARARSVGGGTGAHARHRREAERASAGCGSSEASRPARRPAAALRHPRISACAIPMSR